MFNNHFEVFLADTAESKKIHYSIRYQVYCEEMGFENKKDYPSQLEHDEHDINSIHFIVRDKTSKQWVGAMRLIFKKDCFLPIEKSCELDDKAFFNDLFGTVELSRLCLIKDARKSIKNINPSLSVSTSSKQSFDKNKNQITTSQNKLNRMIIWGLIHAASKYCCSNNIHNWYFMTTSTLAKVLRRGGLNLMNIGEPCIHKGERFPFKMDAIETYQSDIWKNYKNDYQFFSRAYSDPLTAIAA